MGMCFVLVSGLLHRVSDLNRLLGEIETRHALGVMPYGLFFARGSAIGAVQAGEDIREWPMIFRQTGIG